MKVTVVLPTYLQAFAEGEAEVLLELTAEARVADVFDALWKRHSSLKGRVVTEVGDVRPHVNIFVGKESIRFLDGLKTHVKDGEHITVLPAVSGGS